MNRENRLRDRVRHMAEERQSRPESIRCKGCGREIDITDLKLWDKFICGRCMRTMRLNALLFRFRYTRGYRMRKRMYTLILCALIIAFSALWGFRLVTLMGHPVFIHLFTTGVGALVAVYLVVAREVTEEYRLVGAFMVLTMAARRIPLWYFARDWGHPRPYAIIVPAIIAACFGIWFLVLVYNRRRKLPVL